MLRAAQEDDVLLEIDGVEISQVGPVRQDTHIHASKYIG